MDLQELYLPHVGWLRHAANDEVAKFLARGWFEYREQAFVWLYLRTGNTFLDAGAHVGLFSLIAGHAMQNQGTILALEPHPESALLLEQNFHEHQLQCARVRRYALASRPGSVVLHMGAEGRAAYSSLYSGAALPRQVPIEAITLDALLAQEGIASVDLAKIDIEGAEIEALGGASESIRQGRLPLLLIECTEANLRRAGSTTRQLFDTLTEHGYAVCRFDAASRRLVPRPFADALDYDNLFAALNLREVNERLTAACGSAVRISREIVLRGETCEAGYLVESEASKSLESAERARLSLEGAFHALGEANWRAEEAEKRAQAAETRTAQARAEALESERRSEESRQRAEAAARQTEQAYRNAGEANWRAEQAEKRAEAAETRATEFHAQVQESERRAEESRQRAEDAALQTDQAYRNAGEANWRAEQAEKRVEAAELRAAEARSQGQLSERRAEEARQRAETGGRADAFPPPAQGSSEQTDMIRALRHLQERRFRPRVVLDIGAGKGYWSILSRAYFPDAAYYLIDPLAEHEPDLSELCREDARWHYLIGAVAEEAGPRVLTVGQQYDASSLLTFPGAEPSRQRTIPATTIDLLLEQGCLAPPDLVKIDVQGMELEVMRGGARLFDTAEVFIVEVNLFKFMPDCPRVHEIIQHMAERDFYLFDLAGTLRRPYLNDLGQLDLVMVSGRSPLLSSNRWSE